MRVDTGQSREYKALAHYIATHSVEEVRWKFGFENVAGTYWKVPSKSKGFQPFRLRPAQKLLDDEYERQMAWRGYVRMNVLKCRQVGSTYWKTRRCLRGVQTIEARAALTIAHRKREPVKWLKGCRRNIEETPGILMPNKPDQTEGHILGFTNGSSYSIDSVESGFPGMGDTIHDLHLSECGRWDKPPVSKDPNEVLSPLMPAVPSGRDIKGTVIVRESTGVMVGDWWNRQWVADKDGADGYVNLFLPWPLVPEYCEDDDSDVICLSPYEQEIVKVMRHYGMDVSHGQIAWRRNQLRTEWKTRPNEFAPEYPLTEDESFMTAGLAQHTPEMILSARRTERVPIWRGNVLHDRESDHPMRARFEPNPSGELEIWEWPKPGYHYALGADCMWGKRAEGTDWDVLYVERLEPDPTGAFGPLCAKIRGKWPLSAWAWYIAAMGYRFNECPVAPEITGQESAEGPAVVSVLLGESTNDWRYPNVWVRMKRGTIRPRVEDYGWDTRNANVKGTLLGVSQTGSLDGSLDWCDRGAIDEMSTIIRTETGKIEAPAGMHDDCWMGRVITAEVARRERLVTDLYTADLPMVSPMRTPEQRYKEADEQFIRDVYGDDADEFLSI